jgi:hypothetical protein
MLRAILISQESPGLARLNIMLRQIGFGSTVQWSKPGLLLTQPLTDTDAVFIDLDSVPSEMSTWTDGLGSVFETLASLQIPLVLLVSRSVPVRFLHLLRHYGAKAAVLKKPFFTSELQFAVGKACQELQRYRKEILYVGPEVPPNLAREMGACPENLIHWAADLHELKTKWHAALCSKPTILLLDERAMTPEIESFLRRLKCSVQGRRTLIIALSSDAKALQSVRETVDLAYTPKGSWKIWLDELTKLNDQWTYARIGLEQVKRLLSQGRAREARTAGRATLKRVPMDLRLHHWLARAEIALKRPSEALKHLSFALRWNPCLPGLYITALHACPLEQVDFFMKQALLYCPQHPELLLKWSESQAGLTQQQAALGAI